ncbi:MAG TPA: hypothetical protein VN841_06265 [Bryobacteraceae bacterium]|nr:hypothetical protein [Bryobacteraceae bacterium]
MSSAGAPLTERDHLVQAQIDRILQSDTFRSSEALRRLLRFLAERLQSGEADQLKEYSVGIDALGKPASYDPRHDSTVRIQMGRLRQKLADYYRTEGKDDALIVELPKGRFKLTCEPRPAVVEHAEPVAPQPEIHSLKLSPMAMGGAVLLVAVAAWAVYATLELSRMRQETQIFHATWTPELEQLWRPFLATQKPLIVSIADPPFVQFEGYGAYRDLQLNRWEDIIKSPQVQAIQKSLRGAAMSKSVYYAPIGEISASFLIGRLLGPRVPALSLLRTSELSMQQLADNNVLYIGAAVFFADRVSGMPAKLDLSFIRGGVKNDRPQPGEEAFYSDQSPAGSAAEDGEVYALVTHLPGPRVSSEVTAFTANRTPARLAAVQWFTDQAYARTLVLKMRKPSGEIPRYYQVVLKVKFKDGVPTETSYVLHHEVTAMKPAESGVTP